MAHRRTKWNVLDNFVEKFVPTRSGCWLWTAAIDKHGYGVFSIKGKPILAHRFSYMVLVGDIPEGMQIDHLCRVTACVNPFHLEAVTPRQNLERVPTFNGHKTHCKRGHQFTDENTYVRPGGQRMCRACRVSRGEIVNSCFG